MFSVVRNLVEAAHIQPSVKFLYRATRTYKTHYAFNRAAKQGDVATVNNYLNADYNPQLVTIFKQNPILGATAKNQPEVLEQLLLHVKQRQQPNEQLWQESMATALDANFADCVRVFMKYSCKFPVRYKEEIIEAKHSVMHILIGRTVALIPKTEYCYVYKPAFGMTELHMCTGAPYDDQIDKACLWLGNNYSKINDKSKGGMTPLHICAQERSNALLLFLLGRNADVSITNSIHETALGTAARFGNKLGYDLLLDAGSKQTPNMYGETPEQLLAAHKILHKPRV